MGRDGLDGSKAISEAKRSGFYPDMHILRDAILKSVTTSPEAFLASMHELGAQPLEYWDEQLQSSTWAVMQDGDSVLGIAAAKSPQGADKCYADPAKACFIESVWIDPSKRRRRFAEHLLTYLMQERRKAGVNKFHLWVLGHNISAMRLYERMGFKPMAGYDTRLHEIQYVLGFDRDLGDGAETEQSKAALELDRERYGITYRLLTPKTGLGPPSAA